MKKSKSYLPILITFALLGLIGLQIVWLYFVYQYKVQELKDKTHAAVLKTTERLQQEEDTKLIVQNMDSLLITNDVIGSDSAEDIRVIVSKIKNKFKIDTLNINTKIEKQLRIINDSSSSTTIIRVGNTKNNKVIVHSESHINSKSKKRAKDLESLFLKMAVSAQDVRKNIDSRVDSLKVLTILKEELLKRDIDLNPEVGVSYFPKNNKPGSIDYHIVFNTPEYIHILPSMVTMPLFPNDIFGGDLFIKVGYRASTNNFIIKQMAGLLVLSVSITILIGFVMIYIFRRMLNEEKLHQLKNDFINNMTHELKTPIATISLALDSIKNPIIKNNSGKLDEYTAIIKEENKKLDQHVEKVLQMALLEKSDITLKKEQVDLVIVIQNAIKANQLKAEAIGAEIKFELLPAAFITGDEFSLCNAFSNLIDNSLKYSHVNCKINIKLEKENSFYKIIVTDNGIGMDKKELSLIFDKFYRIQRGNLHDVKGSGLGLSYVKSIIDLHKGIIEVNSELGKGSTFIIKLHSNES